MIMCIIFDMSVYGGLNSLGIYMSWSIVFY